MAKPQFLASQNEVAEEIHALFHLTVYLGRQEPRLWTINS